MSLNSASSSQADGYKVLEEVRMTHNNLTSSSQSYHDPGIFLADCGQEASTGDQVANNGPSSYYGSQLFPSDVDCFGQVAIEGAAAIPGLLDSFTSTYTAMYDPDSSFNEISGDIAGQDPRAILNGWTLGPKTVNNEPWSHLAAGASNVPATPMSNSRSMLSPNIPIHQNNIGWRETRSENGHSVSDSGYVTRAKLTRSVKSFEAAEHAQERCPSVSNHFDQMQLSPATTSLLSPGSALRSPSYRNDRIARRSQGSPSSVYSQRVTQERCFDCHEVLKCRSDHK